MSETPVKQKLTAILYADVAGYSRLTGQDEVGTHHQVMAVLDTASETIQNRDGQVLRYAGDAILAEFNSAVAATQAAIDIQRQLAQRNHDRADDDKIQIRIGLNLGEVIQDRGEIYGDGVNLAARLEAAAPPGGVCLSAYVYDQVQRKIALQFVDGGEESFKNIETPIQVYRWHPDGLNVGPAVEAQQARVRPSIAILPFENMSNDPEQEFFADGMTEDLITALSQVTELEVASRNSVFVYKGKTVNDEKIAQDLGVRYLLQGSVRRSGERARITAQLVDSTSSNQLWAERYDRQLDDVFEVQDEITRNIAIALQVQLSSGEHAQIWQGGTSSFEAWQYQVRGVRAFYKTSREGWQEAIDCFDKAVTCDPGYAPAWAALGHSHIEAVMHGEAADAEYSIGRAEEIATKLIADEKSEALGQDVMGNIQVIRKQHDAAIEASRRADQLVPNNPEHLGGLAYRHLWDCQPEAALRYIRSTIKQSPHYPNWVSEILVLSYYLSGDLDAARAAGEQAIAQFPDYADAYINLAGVYAASGMTPEAKKAVEALLELKPEFSLNRYPKAQFFRDAEQVKIWMQHLRRAGLPD